MKLSRVQKMLLCTQVLKEVQVKKSFLKIPFFLQKAKQNDFEVGNLKDSKFFFKFSKVKPYEHIST